MLRSQVVLTAIKIRVVHVHVFESSCYFGVTPISTISWPFEYGENIAKIIIDAFEILPELAEQLPMSLDSFGTFWVVSVDSCVEETSAGAWEGNKEDNVCVLLDHCVNFEVSGFGSEIIINGNFNNCASLWIWIKLLDVRVVCCAEQYDRPL